MSKTILCFLSDDPHLSTPPVSWHSTRKKDVSEVQAVEMLPETGRPK